MLRIIAALIVTVSLAVSCSQRNKLVSISEAAKEKPAQTNCLSWITGPSGGICAGANYSSASGFIHNFSAYSENMPFPIVAWATDSTRKGKAPIMCTEEAPCLDLPDRESWAEALRKMGTWAGPYQTNNYPGFVEIVWASKANEAAIRSSMKKWVPPIILRTRYAADYLTMWHAISGMDFIYDPAVVKKALEYDEKRLLIESDPDLPMVTERPEWPFPLGFVNFTTSEKLAIGDFMPRLAAHIGGLGRQTRNGWIIEQFQRNEQGLNLIKGCLVRMKEDRWDFEDVDILSRIGTPALPELLREFGNPKIDPLGYERQLILVLSRISSPDRDQAFLGVLRKFVAGKRGYFNLEIIIEALMSSNCQDAIPILEQIAAKVDKYEFRDARTAANIALYGLGRKAPFADRAIVSVAPKAKASLSTDVGTQAMDLLRAVLIQSDQYESGMELLSFEKTETQITIGGQYARSSRTVGPHSSWALTIPVLRSDRALVTFGFVCGILCGQGYRGKLKKQNGQWIMTQWERTWVS